MHIREVNIPVVIIVLIWFIFLKAVIRMTARRWRITERLKWIITLVINLVLINGILLGVIGKILMVSYRLRWHWMLVRECVWGVLHARRLILYCLVMMIVIGMIKWVHWRIHRHTTHTHHILPAGCRRLTIYQK